MYNIIYMCLYLSRSPFFHHDTYIIYIIIVSIFIRENFHMTIAHELPIGTYTYIPIV